MIFLLNTITSWEEPPRCRHQVANELSKKYKVIFVEKNKVGFPRIEVVQERTNFIRIIPYWPIDYRLRYRIPLQNEIYQGFLFRKIKKELSFEEQKQLHIINWDHTATQLFRFFSNHPIIYYVNDEYIDNGTLNPWFINVYHRLTEGRIIKKSSHCIATSEYLLKKLKPNNKNSHLILLGAPGDVSSEYFNYNSDNKCQEQIIVACVSFFHTKKLKLDWLKGCLNNPRFKFIFIGPIHKNINIDKEKLTNITFTGPKTYSNLYSIVSQANVCICPYDEQGINPGTTPNKLWLYLALGKPVIIPEIPNIKSWKFQTDIIYKTKDNNQFSKFIEEAFMRDNEKLFKKRIEIAHINSWEQRVKQLLQILNKDA